MLFSHKGDALRKPNDQVPQDRETLLAILEHLPAFIYLQAPDYTIPFANRLFREQFGNPAGRCCYQLFRQQPKPCASCPTFTVFRDGESRIGEWCNHPDGRHFLIYNSRITAAEGRQLVLKFSVDVTEQQQIYEALRESEKKLQDITSSLAEGIYVLDREGLITFINPEGERLLGWTSDELLGKRAHDLIHACRPDGTPLPFKECPIHRVIRTGRRFSSADGFFTRKDGSTFPVSLLSSPIVENGAIVSSVTCFRDISRRKRLEADLIRAQKLESVGLLAAGIAHDFNNLLQTILGNVDLAKLHLSPEERVFRQLAGVEKAVVQAKELSCRLLTFADGDEPLRSPVDITGSLQAAAQSVFSGSKVVARLELADDLMPAGVDEGQIRQVWVNLLRNAGEAMPHGGVVTIRARNTACRAGELPTLQGGDYVEVAFIDQGHGIPPEHLPRIFDPYFTTKARGAEKGMGLGLAVCHSVVGKHRGRIQVDSTPGEGTTFRVLLPAVPMTTAGTAALHRRVVP